MKKNTSLYIYLLILFFIVKISNGFCQTQCITAVNSMYFSTAGTYLLDSGSTISQSFVPTCDGNLSSFLFCYKVIPNEGINQYINFPTNSNGNSIFNMNLTIYELPPNNSECYHNLSSLTKIYESLNIEVPINAVGNKGFKYFTVNTPEVIPLSSSKNYCFVIQLTDAFCNDLMSQKVARMSNGSTANKYDYAAKQAHICEIQFAVQYMPGSYYCRNLFNRSRKKISDPIMSSAEKANDINLAIAVKINPFLPDIQGKNILCPKTRINLTNTEPNGTWSIDNANIATIQPQSDGSVNVIHTTLTSKGLVTLRYTTPKGTTTKLIRVVNDEKPIITSSSSNENQPCQNNGFTIKGVAVNNQALQLDGKSWAEIPSHPALGLTNTLTLEAWVYCSDPKAPQYIISKGNNDQEMGHYGLSLFDNKLQFVIQSLPGYVLKSPITFTNAKWHHVAGSYDGDTMRLYIDGVEVAKTALQTAMIPNNRNLYIGQLGMHKNYYQGGPNGVKITADIIPSDILYRMKGQIDEVRIWNVCRTSQQIKDSMYNTVYANNTGLVGYYKFNEPESADPKLVLDYSGSNNDGKLHSALSTTTYEDLQNITAQKVPASIKFGDFSFTWSNGSTIPILQPTVSDIYKYTVIDSASGCSVTSDATVVKMNSYAIISKTIPVNTSMPYNYNENNINLKFNANDFINNVATKSYSSSPTDGTCPTITTVTISKLGCPSGGSISIKEYGGTSRNLTNITICDQLPYQIEIKGYIDQTTGSVANNPIWDAAPADAIYSLESGITSTRPEFKTLTINNEGTATITYRYTYNGTMDCSLTSKITVKPVSINITTPTPLNTNAVFTATPSGGFWSSTTRTVAAIDQTSGVLTRNYAGQTNIEYRVDSLDGKTCFNPIVKTIPITLQ